MRVFFFGCIRSVSLKRVRVEAELRRCEERKKVEWVFVGWRRIIISTFHLFLLSSPFLALPRKSISSVIFEQIWREGGGGSNGEDRRRRRMVMCALLWMHEGGVLVRKSNHIIEKAHRSDRIHQFRLKQRKRDPLSRNRCKTGIGIGTRIGTYV